MKRIFIALFFSIAISGMPNQKAEASIPILAIIKEAIEKVIKAVDLMVQRLQNKTIWLQNAQKVLENKLNELKLTEIAEWTEKHRKLYKEYYDELWKVKNAIASYQRIKQILERQKGLVTEYKRVWGIVRNDDQFTKNELDYMYRVYSGIMNASVRNLDQVLVVVNSFKTQMSDGKRLEVINRCGEEIEQNYFDLKEFNTQNIQLSLSRAKDAHEMETIRKLYGLSTE
jgi:uncharacterized ubiquitin-like protein YukD